MFDSEVKGVSSWINTGGVRNCGLLQEIISISFWGCKFHKFTLVGFGNGKTLVTEVQSGVGERISK